MATAEDVGFPVFTYYLPSGEYRTEQSVLILPGGGYVGVSSPKEGHRPNIATHRVVIRCH